MKKIAAINDLSGFGKCSLTADIPVISALGVQCCPLPTGILSNQTGYPQYEHIDFTDHMQAFAEQWKNLSPDFDGILSGFISNSRQGKIIADFIDEFAGEDTVVLVDPVMADDGEIYDSYDSDSVDAIKALVSKATVITPNLTELCVLTGTEYDSVAYLPVDEKLRKIRQLSSLMQKTVITTGIPTDTGEVINTVLDSGDFSVIKNKKIGGSFSGTGDILASVVAARLVTGSDVVSAVRLASDFICSAIEVTVRETNGKYNTADGVHFERCLYKLVEKAGLNNGKN